MSEVKPPDFVVIRIPSPDDERFVIMETMTFVTSLPRAFAQPGSTADRLAALQRLLEGLPHLTEAEVRGQLSDRGVPAAEIETRLEKARLLASADFGGIAMETITQIGYRNREGQEVTRKTGHAGPDNQRVFVMRCTVCGHEYGSYGCDADIRRCPACQDGPPGLPAQKA